MPRLITEDCGGFPYKYVPMGEYIVKAKGVCGGRPTFKYTRILVAKTLERVRTGECVDSIVISYRNRVSKDAILEAIEIFKSKRDRRKLYRRIAA